MADSEIMKQMALAISSGLTRRFNGVFLFAEHGCLLPAVYATVAERNLS
jgi:hypothetical protein